MRKTLCLFGVLFLFGCGSSALERAKVVGLTARQTAEAAYLTLRIEYLLGHVDESTMEEARSLYERFRLAQTAYVEALRLWEEGRRPERLEALKVRIETLAARLHRLAEEASAARRQCSSLPPPGATSRPATVP